MSKEKYQKLFLEIMDKLFESTNKKTIQYYVNNTFNEIPEKSGIYTIIKPDTFVIKIKKVLEKPKYFKGKLIQRPLMKKCDNKYLYIGKANNLRARIAEYINFGFSNCTDIYANHGGGKGLWYIENNQNLIVGYIEFQEFIDRFYSVCKNLFDNVKGSGTAEFIESGLMELHEKAYHCLPFANIQYGKYMDAWSEFWDKYPKND